MRPTLVSVALIVLCAFVCNNSQPGARAGSLDKPPRVLRKSRRIGAIPDSNGHVVDKTYGVIVDCGSSGSRVHIYQWDNNLDYGELLHAVEPIRKPDGQPVSMKKTPPLSDLEDQPQEIPGYFEELINFVSDYIPPERYKYTGVYVMATAGMRLLDDKDQKEIMVRVREYIQDNYEFALVKTYVISGAQEGMYQWISVNSKERRFLAPETDTTTKTFAIVEMGGASIQVTYQLRPGLRDYILFSLSNKQAKKAYLGQIISPQMSRSEQIGHNYVLHSTTFLGFGGDSARELLTDLLIKKSQSWNSFSSKARKIVMSLLGQDDPQARRNSPFLVQDPCLPVGFTQEVEKPRKMLSATSQTIGFLHVENEPSFKVKLKGTGNYLKCKQNVVKVLELAKKERLNCRLNEDEQCTMSLVGEKFVPFSASFKTEFRAIGDFYHTANTMLEEAGQYDHDRFVAKTQYICNKSLGQLKEEFKDIAESRDEKVKSRIWNECFRAVWVDTFLTKAIRMPKGFKFLKTVKKLGRNGMDEPEWPLGAVLDKSLAIEKATEDELGEEEVENRSKLNPFSRSNSMRAK